MLPVAWAQEDLPGWSIYYPPRQWLRLCPLAYVFQEETKSLRGRKIVCLAGCFGKAFRLDPFGEFREDGGNVVKASPVFRAS
jgi:hypothetical protein